MERLISVGKWLFVSAFFLYVSLHFGVPEIVASFIPSFLPFPYFWNYFTGTCIAAFMLSCYLGKYDKLASLCMALYVLLMILLVHIPRAAQSENDMLNIFRNIMVIGALLMYAGAYARDKRLWFGKLIGKI